MIITKNSIIEPQNMHTLKPIFRKAVNWSLLNSGLLVPQTAMKAFLSNVTGRIPRGCGRSVKLLVRGRMYKALLNNVADLNNAQKSLQLWYDEPSPVAVLREIFRLSYTALRAKAEGVAVDKEHKYDEYVDIICVSMNAYEFKCFPAKVQDEDLRFIDFTDASYLEQSYPVYLAYFDAATDYVNSWDSLYALLVKYLYEDYPVTINSLQGIRIGNTWKKDLCGKTDYPHMSKPKRITDNLYLETDFSPKSIIDKMRRLLDQCNVDYDNIIIAYRLGANKAGERKGNLVSGVMSRVALPGKDRREGNSISEEELPLTTKFDEIEQMDNHIIDDKPLETQTANTVNEGRTEKDVSSMLPNKSLSADQSNPVIRYADFSNKDACKRSSPVSCAIDGVDIPFTGNWCDVLAAITENLIYRYPDKMEALKSKWFSRHRDSPYLSKERPPISSRRLKNGYWINVHYGIPQLLSVVAGLCRYCDICLDDVIIAYTLSKGAETEKTPTNRLTATSTTYPLDDIVDLEEGKAGIRQILNTHFQTLYGYSNLNILWSAAQNKLSMFLNDNAINTPNDLWAFLQGAFSGEYSLSNSHIWQVKPDFPYSNVGVIVNLCRKLGGRVSREEIEDYFSSIKQNAPINRTIIQHGQLMFYANKVFILADVVQITDERRDVIKNALDKLFMQESAQYIILRDIVNDWYLQLPEIIGHPWTPLLIQEVLRLNPVIGYHVISSGLDGQSFDTLGIAVVPDKSHITSFADVAHYYCYENDLLTKKMPTEDLRSLLRDAGMIFGNELITNLHKALNDHRFAFTNENKTVKILEK